MRMRPSQSRVMKRKVGSTLGLRICNDEMILFGDAGPVVDAGAAERVDGELEGGVGEDVEVDDVGEVVDVGGDVVVAVGGGGGEGFGVGDASLRR